MNAAPPAASNPQRGQWTPAACGSERLLGGFLRVLELDAAGAADHADGFERLRTGALQAIVVRGVYPPEVMAAAVERLARHDPPFLRTRFPSAFKAWFYGRNVNLADPALSGYFSEAATFNAQLAALLPQPPQQRIAELLAALDGGRRFLAAPGPQPGEHYMFTTLRAHQPGGFIPPHFDNEVRLRPSYRHLARQVSEHIQSFVLTLDAGEGGGALEVFDSRCEPQAARLLNDDHAPPAPDTTRIASVSFRLPPGAMIVLDSGRYLHQVTPVLGARTRWTACSFMARARAADATYLWG